MHDATKTLLGSTESSARDISCHSDDPANFPAGKVVSLNTDGELSVVASDGMRIGISLGKSLSDTKKTSVARCGERIPVLLEARRAHGVITVSSYANLVSGTDDAITVAGQAFTAQAGAVTPGDPTFQAATSNADTAISLAALINAHAVVGLAVKAIVTSSGVVTLIARASGVAGNDIGLTYTDNDSNIGAVLSGLSANKLSGGAALPNYVVKGAKAYINDDTGIADEVLADVTISDATYVSGVLTGIKEDGTSAYCALVDIPGGL